MFPASFNERLDTLIDDLIMNGGVEAASLASILLAAKDSVKCEYHATLSRRVWSAVNEINTDTVDDNAKAAAECEEVYYRMEHRAG